MKPLFLLLCFSLLQTPTFSQDAPTQPKVAVIMPSYPGGETALFQYISDSLKYPQEAIESGITGIVVTSFIIGESGLVESVKVEKGIDPSCDKAAIDLIEKMSNWIPASKDGRAVKVQYMMPIQFDLQQAYPSKRKKNKK